MKSALKEGLLYLSSQQQDDGSFLSLSSPRQQDFTGEKEYRSVFPAALILSCLTPLPDDKTAGDIKDKLVRFLLSQKSEHWSFNYWARDSREAKAKPYPDDLDDTFCALAALTLFDRSLIDGGAMAQIVTTLTAAEQREGGPYRTWLVPEDAGQEWRDVDLAVNSNVAYFLSLHGVDLPNQAEMIESAVAKGEYTSRYYPLPYPVVYFISRWYRGAASKDVRRWLLRKRYSAGNWGNPLSTALAATSLLNLGVKPGEVKVVIGHIKKQQQPDGSWPTAAFCLDPAVDQRPYYAGSAALTTAFCLEAIAKYTQAKQGSEKKPRVLAKAGEQQRMQKIIAGGVRKRINELPPDLKQQAIAVFGKTVRRDKDGSIALMPFYFRTALGRGADEIHDALIEELGRANMFGWMAYTIYDDFLDDEGDPKLLPVANACLREAMHIFDTHIPNEVEFSAFVWSVMDRVDGANAWETINCRDVNQIPDYGDLSQLADKSLGHALGPMAILFAMGYSEDSPEIKHLMSFFRHYLIARQLNDDAHDWEDDLKRGQVNVVGAMLLRLAKERKMTVAPDGESLAIMRQLFWEVVIEDACGLVIKHGKGAREALGQMGTIKNPGFLLSIIGRVEASARQTLKEKNQTQEFLSAYQV